MNDNAPQSRDPDNGQTQQGRILSIIALFLAFTPAALLLGLFSFKPNVGPAGLKNACILSAICCFVSSFMLFSRRTSLAILAGVGFFILNGLIAFFLGCAASFRL
jgi:hypothetical protein